MSFNTNTQFADSILSNVFTATDSKVSALLDKYNLNWNVNKVPLVIAEGFHEPTPTPFYALVREGTGHIFESTRDTFEVFQNTELAELLFRISEHTGFEISNGGMFKHGARVYLQLETGELKGIGQNNDSIKKYATVLNGHDGKIALKWGHTNITISCQNTFNYAFREMKNSARHTSTMREKVEQSLRQLQGIEKIEKIVMNNFMRLAETPMTSDSIKQIVSTVLDVKDCTLSEAELKAEYSTYKLNRMNEFLKCIQQETEQKGETMWGLMSGVTKYTTHVMPVVSSKNSTARIENKYTGAGFRVDNEIYSMLTK